jgi:hypothetical protein
MFTDPQHYQVTAAEPPRHVEQPVQGGQYRAWP